MAFNSSQSSIPLTKQLQRSVDKFVIVTILMHSGTINTITI